MSLIFVEAPIEHLVIRNGRVVVGRIRSSVSEVMQDAGGVKRPKFAKVRAHRELDGAPVGQTWSDPQTGLYTISGLDESELHYVVAQDPTENFRMVAADRLKPEGK